MKYFTTFQLFLYIAPCLKYMPQN